jgi:hypothetical protein
MNLADLGATQLVQMIVDGEISSLELVEACIGRIDEKEDEVHAWVHLDYDFARKQAEQAIAALKQHAVMQTLQGKPISAFIKTLTVACEQEQLPERDIGILCYVPRTVSQFKAQQKTANIKAEFTNSKQLGAIGEKVTANITIFAERNMTQWDSTLYEANDDKGNLITFFKSYHSKGDDYVVGQTYRITGKVKKAEASKYSFNAIVNTLNFVKIAK